MMLLPRVFAYVRILAPLITTIQAAAVFERQATLTNLLSTITDGQGTAHETQSPSTTVTKTVVITSTASLSLPPAGFTTPVASTFILTKVQSGHTSFSTVTVTLNPELMTTVPHHSPTSSPLGVTKEHSTDNKGAIAGSVLGALAVIVAAFAVFVWFKRRSPKHWRNRTVGRWQSFDNKDVGSAGALSVYVGEPVYRARGDIKQSDPDPLPALYIRERQPAVDQFGDAPGSPPCSRKRAGSYSSGRHRRRESSTLCVGMELQPTTGSPK